MKLISCSFYNSWHTLKREGTAELGDEKRKKSVSVSKIPPGHNTLEGLAKVINGLYDKYGYRQLEAEINIPEAILRDLANIFAINQAVKLITNVKRPQTSFILHSL